MTEGHTRISVIGPPGQPVIDLEGELVAPRVMRRSGHVRLSLVATQALLLGGDQVSVRIDIGAGQRVDIEEATGTVAYDGRGAKSAWNTHLTVGLGAHVRYLGQPFVVSDGADVTRSSAYEVAAGGSLQVHESVVFGRHGQVGGRLRAASQAWVDGREVWLEEQDLDRHTAAIPGLLGDYATISTWLHLGNPALDPLERLPEGAVTMALLDGAGSLTRHLG